MRYSRVFREYREYAEVRVFYRMFAYQFAEVYEFLVHFCIFTELGEFLHHFCGSFCRIWVMRLPHLGHGSAAFGSCVCRIWVMRLPHLGHGSAAFGSCVCRIWGPGGNTKHCRVIPDTATKKVGLPRIRCGSVLKIRTLPRIRRRQF